MITKQHTRGISVVEAVVAIAVFSVVSLVGYQVFFETEPLLEKKFIEQKALWLAQEGIESAYAISQNDFDALTPGVWGISDTSGVWEFSGVEDVVDEYTRTITIADVDADTKTVLSEVAWDYKNESEVTSFEIEVTNWNKIVEIGSSELVIIDSGAQLSGKSLRDIYLSTTSVTPLIVEAIEISWTKNGRLLTEIRSPQSVRVFGPGSASSGDTISIVPITVSNASDVGVRFVFSKNMSGSDFTITFILDDGSMETVTLSGL